MVVAESLRFSNRPCTTIQPFNSRSFLQNSISSQTHRKMGTESHGPEAGSSAFSSNTLFAGQACIRPGKWF